MIPFQLSRTTNYWPHMYAPNNISMMTRYCSRGYIPRTSYPSSPKRPTLRNSSFHYFRSILLPRILLSFLPFKPSPYSRVRWLLTANWNSSTKPSRSSPPKHLYSTSLRSINHMSPSQSNRRKPKTNNSSPDNHHYIRLVLYHSPSHRILRIIIHNFRWHLWFNIFRSHRIPRPTCNYWIHISHCMLTTTIQLSLHIYPPLRLRSCCLILTLRRRSLTFPLCFNLLMRLIFF